MHRFCVALHRGLGLFTAAFLFVSGLTGAVISWDHSLDAWLNPRLFRARSGMAEGRPLLSALELAHRLEASDPRLRVKYLPLHVERGQALMIFVDPKLDPKTGKPYVLPFNQVSVDPSTGEIQGQRQWGAISVSRANLLPFLYKLHYTLHLPDLWGAQTGMLFMGTVAIAWVLDGLAALYISFPSPKQWRRSFAFRFNQGGRKLLFDLHRSSGVWIWALLLILGVTAVSLNLGPQLVRPLVSLFSPLTPSPFEKATPPPPGWNGEPLSRERVVEKGREEAARLGLRAPLGGLFFEPLSSLYGVGLFEPGLEHGDGGLGNPWLYFDGRTGEPRGFEIPGRGSAGDLFMQAQFPLHSGRIAGLWGRALISLLGVMVAGLSATGVWIWVRRTFRGQRRARSTARSLQAVQPT